MMNTTAARVSIRQLAADAEFLVHDSAHLHGHERSPGQEIDELLGRLRAELRERFDADEFED